MRGEKGAGRNVCGEKRVRGGKGVGRTGCGEVERVRGGKCEGRKGLGEKERRRVKTGGGLGLGEEEG